MKIVFFTFYYPPDLCAGSFRASALAQALSKKMANGDELHIITTHPNRYKEHSVKAENIEVDGKITIHRIEVPEHNSGMLLQIRTFSVYAVAAYRLCKRLNPNFLIGTTSRLMTGILTGFSAYRLNCRYFIDLRDIFSETISDFFSRKSKILGNTSRLVFSFLEVRLFDKAAGVNVVSEAFPGYFQEQGVDTSSWSFFSNGVDKEFINLSLVRRNHSQHIKTILYAGNIGSGQGLDLVIPEIAKQLGSSYHFVIIGDGGAFLSLSNAIKAKNISNVELLPPVTRLELVKYYLDADIMFLHLNNVSAFRRVLPSKIFEYIALRKPIVAGLSGYSAKFLKDHAPYAFLFDPGNSKAAVSSIVKAVDSKVSEKAVDKFVTKYSRSSIMSQMANKLVYIIESSE